MSIKVDEIDLIKKIERDGKIKEVRSINSVRVINSRTIIELKIPGMDGNVLQNMGTVPLRIHISGEFFGISESLLNPLKSKYNSNEPCDFVSSILTLSNLKKVKIVNLNIEIDALLSGNTYKYEMVLDECNQ